MSRVRHLFEGEHLALVLDAVIAGNTPARVWADDLTSPRTALVWDGTHSIYLADAGGCAHLCRGVFNREIAPEVRGVLKAYVGDAAARTLFTGHPLHRRERVLYRGTHLAIPHWRQRLPAGFRISSINGRFAEIAALDNFANVLGEIESCWNSVRDFQRSGLGFAAHDAETIVCWCTSEYVSARRCGIGVETIAGYQGRGFAALTASAFVEQCFERGMTPYWDAWAGNLPSRAVAEKIGFDQAETYSIFVGALLTPRSDSKALACTRS